MISLKTRSIVVLTDEQTHLISGGSDNPTTVNATNGTNGSGMGSVECPPTTTQPPDDPGWNTGGNTIINSQLCPSHTDDDGCQS